MNESKDISERVARRLFGQRKPSDIPYILCRRNEPAQHTYELQDTTWEGLKPTFIDGRPGFQIDHNFVLRIGMDGYCMIPETKNNVARLNKISVVTKKKVKVKVKKYNFTTMQEDESEVEETIRPQYERVEESLVEDSIVDRLAEKVLGALDESALERMLENMRQKRGEPAKIIEAEPPHSRERPKTNVHPVPERTVPTTNVSSNVNGGVTTNGSVKGARRGGRPRAEVAPATA